MRIRWASVVAASVLAALWQAPTGQAKEQTSGGFAFARRLDKVTLETVSVPNGRVTIEHQFRGRTLPDRFALSPDGGRVAWTDGRKIHAGPRASFPQAHIMRLPADGPRDASLRWAHDGSALAIMTRTQLDDVDFDGPSLYRLWIWRPDGSISQTTFRNDRFISLLAFDARNEALFWYEPVDGGGWLDLERLEYRTGERVSATDGSHARRRGIVLSEDLQYAFWTEPATAKDEPFRIVRRFDFQTGMTRTVWTFDADDRDRSILGLQAIPTADTLLVTMPGRSDGHFRMTMIGLDGTEERRLSFGSGWCHRVTAWSPDGRYAWVSPSWNSRCDNGDRHAVYDRQRGRFVTTIPLHSLRSHEVSAVGWVPDAGDRPAAGGGRDYADAQTITLPFAATIELPQPGGRDPVAGAIQGSCLLAARATWLRFVPEAGATIHVSIKGSDDGVGLLVARAEDDGFVMEACIPSRRGSPKPTSTSFALQARGGAAITLEADQEYAILIALCRKGCGRFHPLRANTASIALTPLGTISGTVVDCAGDSSDERPLTLFDDDATEVTSGRLSQKGTYTLRVPPGTYRLRIGPERVFRYDFATQDTEFVRDIPPRWFPDARGWNRAEPIPVGPGDEVAADVRICDVIASAAGPALGPVAAIALPGLLALAWIVAGVLTRRVR